MAETWNWSLIFTLFFKNSIINTEFLELFAILHYYHYLMTVNKIHKPLALHVQIEPRHEETSFYHLWTTKVQICLHIHAVWFRAFVVHCLDSIIHTLAQSKISRLQLVSVAEHAGLSLTWSQTPKDRFSRDVAQLGHVMRKRVLCHMRTTKVQISLRIRAVWSAPLLFAA